VRWPVPEPFESPEPGGGIKVQVARGGSLRVVVNMAVLLYRSDRGVCCGIGVRDIEGVMEQLPGAAVVVAAAGAAR
jgi:hypothetical protein